MSKSQQERLISYLTSGKSINGMTSWDLLGIYRLAARIFELREMGHQIESRMMTGKNRYKETVRWKEYRLCRKK